jgi:hypothetical protein
MYAFKLINQKLNYSLTNELEKFKRKNFSIEKNLIAQAQNILNNDLISEKEILRNLQHYLSLEELITEEEVDSELIFDIESIKKTAINLRLKFLDSKFYKTEIPQDVLFEIKRLNKLYNKELKHFKVLSLPESFSSKAIEGNSILFCKTNHNNYFRIYEWGKPIRAQRKVWAWPLKSLETLSISIIIFTLIIDLILPTNLITLDREAQYWCGYRAGTFFHLLIFFSGFTAYAVITFAKNFSTNLWDRKNSYD